MMNGFGLITDQRGYQKRIKFRMNAIEDMDGWSSK